MGENSMKNKWSWFTLFALYAATIVCAIVSKDLRRIIIHGIPFFILHFGVCFVWLLPSWHFQGYKLRDWWFLRKHKISLEGDK
jgi:hypothetical protein